MSKYLLGLIGNQNCGKTTLFNRLTGSNQHVGNFPGVTVDKKSGIIKKLEEAEIVDVPGIYSLSPYTSEEIVTRDFILHDNVDAIINIIDATNIERNLYLTLQLMELNKPMVIALNMMDEVIANGNYIDVKQLSEWLNVPVVPISAAKDEGISDLIKTIKQTLKHPTIPMKKDKKNYIDFCEGSYHKCIHSISHLVEEKAKTKGYPLKFAVSKIIEGDPIVIKDLDLSDDILHIIEEIIQVMEKELRTDRNAAMADMRYSFIEKVCKDCVVVKHEVSKQQKKSEQIDKILTHKYLGIPIFLLIMLTIFWLTFNVIGAPLQEILESLLNNVTHSIGIGLKQLHVSTWLYSLIIDGVCAGVSSVLSFLPIIVLLFFFLSLLEDTGYMARVAYIMDKALRKIGLSGRSFVPMLLGFGCSVPAIMATRTLNSEKDRKMTILLTPFMSCSAKIPIYGMITEFFFPSHATLVMFSMYLLGILVAIISGLILSKTIFKGDSVPFVMELPTYRIPDAKSVLLHMLEKAKDFIRKAFTIIFIGSILIWFLQSFDFSFNMVHDASNSILAHIGHYIAYVFKPLGFSDWRAGSALISGIAAKESVVSTLEVLAGNKAALGHVLTTIFTPSSALAFLAFTILYIPCIAAFATMKQELNSFKEAVFMALYQTGVAYIVGMLIYTIFNMIL